MGSAYLSYLIDLLNHLFSLKLQKGTVRVAVIIHKIKLLESCEETSIISKAIFLLRKP